MTDIAVNNLRAQARDLRAAADRFDAVAVLLKALAPSPHTNPPIVEIAQALQKYGLCIASKAMLTECHGYISQELENGEMFCPDRSLLLGLECALQNAIDGYADKIQLDQ